MRVRFDEQLSLLNRELLEMGSLIEQSIRSATQALIRQDVEAANAAIASDHEVDQKEREIEALCLKLLLQQQPVARDLRQISGLVIYLAGAPYLKKLEHLPQMAEAAIRMVTGSLDAYVNKDLELARRVMEMDDIIDDLFDVVKNELIGLIRKNAVNGSQAIDLLMIAKYFERIGDHAQNIAEWVEYAITGKHKGEYLA